MNVTSMIDSDRIFINNKEKSNNYYNYDSSGFNNNLMSSRNNMKIF